MARHVVAPVSEIAPGTCKIVSVAGREIGRVWRELAGPVYPAMAGIGTTALWQPEAMIEIMGVAVIPDEVGLESA